MPGHLREARLYGSALDLWPPEDPSRPQLLLSYGEALYESGQGAEDVLEESVRALTEAGDLDGAARGETTLAQVKWQAGLRDLAYGHLDRAVDLLQDAPRSPAKADVLTEVSRYRMLGGQNEEAIGIGREALEMAEEFGLEETVARGLNNVGTARAMLGDAAGLEDIRRGMRIATASHSVEIFRSLNNLGAAYMHLGDFRGAVDVWNQGLKAVERFGRTSNAEWLLFQRQTVAYGEGKWDELLRLSEEFLARPNAPYYLAGSLYEFRGRVRLARGDVAGAVADAQASLENGRQAKDPQRLQPALAFSAFTAFHAGKMRECGSLLQELIEVGTVREPIASVIAPVLDLAWLLTRLGRAQDFLDEAAHAPAQNLWRDAAVAFASGQLEGAVEICSGIGVLPQEAYMRLQAGRRLLEEGRRSEGEEQLRRAIEFYRSVGAVFHINEAEELLAASA